MPASVGVQIRLPLLQLLTGHDEHTRFRCWHQPWPLTPVMPWGISSLCQHNLLTRNKCCLKPSHSNVCSGRRPAWGGRGGVCCDCLAARYRSGEGYTKKTKNNFVGLTVPKQQWPWWLAESGLYQELTSETEKLSLRESDQGPSGVLWGSLIICETHDNLPGVKGAKTWENISKLGCANLVASYPKMTGGCNCHRGSCFK